MSVPPQFLKGKYQKETLRKHPRLRERLLFKETLNDWLGSFNFKSALDVAASEGHLIALHRKMRILTHSPSFTFIRQNVHYQVLFDGEHPGRRLRSPALPVERWWNYIF